MFESILNHEKQMCFIYASCPQQNYIASHFYISFPGFCDRANNPTSSLCFLLRFDGSPPSQDYRNHFWDAFIHSCVTSNRLCSSNLRRVSVLVFGPVRLQKRSFSKSAAEKTTHRGGLQRRCTSGKKWVQL